MVRCTKGLKGIKGAGALILAFSRRELTVSLGAGGAATSALVPWNTCGMFMLSVLGVSAFAYARYAFFNLLMPFCAILAAFLFKRKTPYQNMNPQTQQETL